MHPLIKFRKSLHYKTITLILKHKKIAYTIFFLDLFFAMFLYGFSFITTSIIPKDANAFIRQFSTQATALTASLAIAVIYILIMLLIYSFFKYGVIDLIHSLFRKTDFDFKNVLKFYKLNIAVVLLPATLFAAFFALANVLFVSRFAVSISWIFLIILILVIYPFLNIAHALFTRNYPIKKIVKIAYRLALKPKLYLSVYVFSAAALTVFLLFFYLIGLLLGATVFQDPLTFQQYYPLYGSAFAILLAIVLYKIIFFNRIYFYVIVESFVNKP